MKRIHDRDRSLVEHTELKETNILELVASGPEVTLI